MNLSEYNEKIQEIVNNYNEIKNKLYENYIQKYAELFFSSNELENINIIKLIKIISISWYLLTIEIIINY